VVCEIGESSGKILREAAPRRKRMSITRIVLTALVAAVVGPAAAYADTDISFSSLSQPGSTYASVGSTYTQQGFTFTSGSLYVWEASSPSLPGLSTTDTSLFEFFAAGTTSMAATGNAPFTLKSIDLAPLIAGGSSTFTVTFTGTFADSSTVSQTFTVSDNDTLQTFDFSGFTNIVKLSFTQGTNSGFFGAQDTAYQFDNVDIASAASGVPEPGSLSLIGIGATGLIGFSRKRRRMAGA
jgi:hypothetical protein